jgi:hypothetical protein
MATRNRNRPRGTIAPSDQVSRAPITDYVLEVVRPVPDLDLRVGDRVVVFADIGIDAHPMRLVRTLTAERAVILAWNAGDLDLVSENGPTPSKAADALRLGGQTGRIVRGETLGRKRTAGLTVVK